MTLRGLRREHGFAVASILLLTLGIGLASAVFTLLWQVVYAQLPVPEPSRLFVMDTNVTHMGRSDSDSGGAEVFSAPMYRYLEQHLASVPQLWRAMESLQTSITPEGPKHLNAELVSGNSASI